MEETADLEAVDKGNALQSDDKFDCKRVSKTISLEKNCKKTSVTNYVEHSW